MICYRDMTFCGDSPSCGNRNTCELYLSPYETEKAIKWWGGENFPVSIRFFADTCGEFYEDENQPNPKE